MRGIAIYVEGGGNTAEQRRELRIGFDELLRLQKQRAQGKQLRWKTVPSGGRQETYEAFVHELMDVNEDTLCILLVDSEDAIVAEVPKPKNETPQAEKERKRKDAQKRKEFLVNRDHWDLTDASPECVHLMVRCMEAWIVADPDALSSHYAKGFHAKSLPVRSNLEDEPKPDLYEELAKATKNTKKGAYAKIKHAAKLLGLIAPNKVAARCPPFSTFVSWLDEQISSA